MTKNRDNHNYIQRERFVFTQLLYCRDNFENKFLKSFNLRNLFLLIIEFSWLLTFLENDMLLRKKDWKNEYLTMKLWYTFCSFFSYLKRQSDNTSRHFHWDRFIKIWESCQNRWNKLMSLQHKALVIKFSGFLKQVAVIICWIIWHLPLLSKWLGKDTEDPVWRICIP